MSGNVIDESEVLIDGPRASSKVDLVVSQKGVGGSSSFFIHWRLRKGEKRELSCVGMDCCYKGDKEG